MVNIWYLCDKDSVLVTCFKRWLQARASIQRGGQSVRKKKVGRYIWKRKNHLSMSPKGLQCINLVSFIRLLHSYRNMSNIDCRLSFWITKKLDYDMHTFRVLGREYRHVCSYLSENILTFIPMKTELSSSNFIYK